MEDEIFIRHLEKRHTSGLKMDFVPDEEGGERKIRARPEWESFHNTMHRLGMHNEDGHEHSEE